MSCKHPKEKWDKIRLRSRIFKEAQQGLTNELALVHERQPDFHWSSLRFERSGDTAIHICAELGHSSVIEYLLKAFQPNAVNCRNNDDKTALHVAAQFSQLQCCEVLVKYGADVNALKRADWTPLMLACTKTDKEVHSNVIFNTVELLLDKGALVNVKNKDGWTALHVISREGLLNVFNLLLKHNSDLHLKTKNGRTVLHVAALHGNFDIVEACVNLGLYIDEKDNCGNTALHEALLGKSLEICQLLIDSGANIHEKNNCDFGLLHMAASIDDIKMINFVHKLRTFNINDRNKNGWTALHCAARKNLSKVFDYLIQKRADKSIKDNFGRTAEEYFT